MIRSFTLITVVACTVISTSAADISIIDKLNQEEATWHKGVLFSTASSAKDATEYLAVLNWLKARVLLPSVPDSRYAMTYSMMLGGTKDPSVMDTANAFAIIGYATLQVDSARCENRQESLAIARQWYDTVRQRLLSLKELPVETRERYWKYAEFYIQTYANRKDPAQVTSSTWTCRNSQSYLAKIQKLPDVVVETRPGQKGTLNVYYSHPSVPPDLATPEEFDKRTKSILKEVQALVFESK